MSCRSSVGTLILLYFTLSMSRADSGASGGGASDARWKSGRRRTARGRRGDILVFRSFLSFFFFSEQDITEKDFDDCEEMRLVGVWWTSLWRRLSLFFSFSFSFFWLPKKGCMPLYNDKQIYCIFHLFLVLQTESYKFVVHICTATVDCLSSNIISWIVVHIFDQPKLNEPLYKKINRKNLYPKIKKWKNDKQRSRDGDLSLRGFGPSWMNVAVI